MVWSIFSSIEKSASMSYDTLQEIKARCDERGNCWLWQGAVNSKGYPQAKKDGGTFLVRRHVFYNLLANIPSPGRATLKTLCGNSLCLSPNCIQQNVPKPKNIKPAGAIQYVPDPINVRWIFDYRP
jgi:hypothetical protein